MPEANQITKSRADRPITAQDLLAVPDGEITEAGLRWNIDVGLQYVESWLRGSGCVPIYNLMEDAATAEISRAQVWQWVKHGARMTNGQLVTESLVRQILRERTAELGNSLALQQAAQILDDLMTGTDFNEFLTLASYDRLE
jgi:malate synthase